MGNVQIQNINANIPVQGLANDSAKLRENFRLIKEALNQANAEIQTLQVIIGPSGPLGPTGPIGLQGVIGPTGPQGIQGFQGIRGPTGIAGAQGTPGSNGATGPTGPQGLPSIVPGPKGDKGEMGSIGPTGPTAVVNAGSKTTMGILRVGSNINVTSGTIDLNAQSITSALGYTPVTKAELDAAIASVNAKSLDGYVVGEQPDNILKITPEGTLPAIKAPDLILPEPAKITGLQPQRVDQDRVRVTHGTCTDHDAEDTITIRPGIPIDIDLKSLIKGLGALDRGTVTPGVTYYIYVLKNPITGICGALASRSSTPSGVSKPPGFTRIRKLPWGFVYTASGIRKHLITNWPSPFTQFVDLIPVVSSGATNSAWFTVDCSPFVPANATKVFLQCSITGYGAVGTTSTEGVYTSGNILTSAIVPSTQQAPGNSMQIWLPLTSNRTFAYSVGDYSAITISIVGYQQTELT